MAYLPPVVARLTFDLGDFNAKVDEAKAKLDSLNKSFTDTVHVKLDDSQAGQLKNMAQDLEALHRIGGQQATEGIKVQGFEEASAKLDDMALKMDRLNGRTATVRVKVNKSDLDQAESFLSAMKKLFTGGPDINLPFTSMGASPMGLAAITAAITALLPELSGLVGGFAAAGAGAGAFAALAAPAIKSVTTAMSDLKTAQANFGKADLLEKVAPSAAHLKALDEARDKLHAAQAEMKKLGPDATQAASGMQTLSNRFHSLASAFKPEVFKIFNDALKIANDLMPTLGPMAKAFADALDPLLKQFDKFTQSKDFQQWMTNFTSRIGPALTAIGEGLGKAGPALGRFMTALSSQGSVNAINIAFTVLTGTLNALTATVRFLSNAWSGMSLFGHNVASTFDSVRHSIASFGHDVAHDFDQIRHTIASFSPSALISKAFSGISGIVKSAFAGAQQWFSNLWNGAKSAIDKAVGFFKGSFNKTKGDVTSAFAGAEQWFSGLWNGAKSAVSKALTFMESLPGKIKNVFAGALGWLESVGENIIQGLINGLKAKLGPLGAMVGQIVGLLKSVGSAVGVKSPSTLFDYYGRMIGLGLAQGIESQYSRVQQSANGLTGMVTGSAAAAAGHGSTAVAGGQDIHVHVHLDGREITNAVAQRAVRTQSRTGTNQFTKRTR